MDGQNTNPNMNPGVMQNKESSVGPMIGVIIILAVVVLGGLYFWSQRDDRNMMYGDDNTAADIEKIDSQSDSDDVSSIEADLNNTEVDSLDAELNAS